MPGGDGQPQFSPKDQNADSNQRVRAGKPPAHYEGLDQDAQDPASGADTAGSPIVWEASEYIHHQKDATWYLALFGATFLLAVAFFFLVDWFSALVIIIMGVVLGVAGGRKPRVQRFSVSDNGISIGARNFDISEFRSFNIEQEGAVYCVTFMPVKRFMPPISMYAPAEYGEPVVAILESILPHEDSGLDFVDRLIRNIRF